MGVSQTKRRRGGVEERAFLVRTPVCLEVRKKMAVSICHLMKYEECLWLTFVLSFIHLFVKVY